MRCRAFADSGDRAASRDYFVLENYVATESANATSGRLHPGFSDAMSAVMMNPFVQFRGLEFPGVCENATVRGQEVGGVAQPERNVSRRMAGFVYRSVSGGKRFAGGRWNTVTGDVSGANTDITVTRTNFGGGWWITPGLLLKAEYVNQAYDGFARRTFATAGASRALCVRW